MTPRLHGEIAAHGDTKTFLLREVARYADSIDGHTVPSLAALYQSEVWDFIAGVTGSCAAMEVV